MLSCNFSFHATFESRQRASSQFPSKQKMQFPFHNPWSRKEGKLCRKSQLVKSFMNRFDKIKASQSRHCEESSMRNFQMGKNGLTFYSDRWSDRQIDIPCDYASVTVENKTRCTALPAVDRAGDEVGYPSIWVIQKTLLNLVRSIDQWSDGPTD